MPQTFPDNLYLHAINLMPQFGPVRLMQLAKHFGSFAEAFTASAQQLLQVGLSEELVKKFLSHRQQLDLETEAKNLDRYGIKVLSFRDKPYWQLLKEIPKAPPLLYIRGAMNEPEELCVAVVGTRQITNYGRLIIPRLIEPLIDVGMTIVSGMAFGVDSTAQELAVKKGQRTIAVLGGGLDDESLYPKHHQFLAQKILDAGGALISEYPTGTANLRQNFVARNRIISGLAVATIVIECDLQSGTLITAKHALDQNRTLYAVPGPIYSPQSQGPNNLIKMGAKPMTSANDLLEDLNLATFPEQKFAREVIGDTKEEMVILKMLGYEPVIIDELINQSGLEPAAVTSALTFLEMKGKVRNLGGQQYVLSR